jgi:Ca-activated chloride channel family protein
VPVHVSDEHGQFVDGLKQSQFRLLEDGVPQEISAFLAEDAAVSLLLALDISGSMTVAVDELKAASRGFLQALRPSDKVTLAGFNNGLFLLAPPTAGPDARLASLDRLRPFGRTALFDSMIRAAELLDAEPAPRALVVFTDGDDISSLATVDGVRAALQTKNVVLYMIGQGKADQDAALRTRLTTLALETGGAAYFSSRMSSLRDHFADIVYEISHQYVLSYVPLRDLGDGGWRKIEVRVQAVPMKVSVRARQGYLALRRSGGGVP